ncbi:MULTISPECIES: DNA polymerase III subunit delta' [unclassified Hyphomonas]|jgi:DNA polymerase-3 subunit delta'|uniref:DNA polymerase III subunit delta' n=1 Tax=unclassified Hyphomonas TaxID=2630699 RepID=UPI000C5AD918|nr:MULTISPECIES: DNA polymerase III subunit delta' [unclassified Hyphomonas]MAA83125.1 DNA polymerase III subunit delta' [Hyphomonas sp.]MAN89429.1 DNA polymerase III subunit delta' [Hyphomonadaceae bacterium]HCN92480.1 DNA polymerase III subunit delta' [Hyphomonas sp.]|tara:strand:- start:6603 stop:7538 length:936 start_codon:yes stop_codon:yes gene_type:complete
MSIAWPLYGHDTAEASFLASATTGKLHHGWLIEGPSGIGKATMANRLAAYMLGARGREAAPLDADSSDPVARTCLTGAHPDLRVVHRELNDKGKLRQDISVDQVRELIQFFSLKPAQGGWRVGIIDSLDELNRNGANALLKTLEEPPEHSILFLVNHGTTPILPTIRSRCRVLRVSALGDEDTKRALETATAPAEAASLSKGRPGLGVQLSTPAGLAASHAAKVLLRSLPRPNDGLVTDALQTASADDTAMQAFQEEILTWLAQRAEQEPAAAKAWLEVSRLAGEARALKMDPAQTASKLIAGLYSAAKAH